MVYLGYKIRYTDSYQFEKHKSLQSKKYSDYVINLKF